MNNSKKDIKEQITQHIQAIKELSKIISNAFVSSKEERKNENLRKAFHIIGGMTLPFLILLLPYKICIILNIIVLIPVLIIDYNNLLLFFNKIPNGNIITQLLREHELIKGKLSGLSWLLIGCLTVITVFDKYLVALSITIFVIGDASAALIGKNFGKIKICCEKTLEGTMSFIISSFIVYIIANKYIALCYGINFNHYFITIAIFISAIVELFSKNVNIDDNFAIPCSFCLTYKICSIF